MCAHAYQSWMNYFSLGQYFLAIIEHKLIMLFQFEMEAGLTRKLYFC